MSSSILPPAQPSYIFRGHAAAIYSVQVVRQNTRLLTGDADGWVVLWKLESKRPVAVWRAHDAAILGTGDWLSDRVITHGRDNALRIWQLGVTDEVHLSCLLPTDGPTTHHPKPWLLHMLPVNTLNFCAFSMLAGPAATTSASALESASHYGLQDSVLVAVPARDDSKIEVYRFPDEKLIFVVPRVQHADTGMVMAVKLTYQSCSNNIILIAGYEGGFTAVHRLGINPRTSSQAPVQPMLHIAETIYLSRPHTQPILSLDVSPDAKVYFTSSADAVIAAHRIPDVPLNIEQNENASLDAGTGRSTKQLPVPETSTFGLDVVATASTDGASAPQAPFSTDGDDQDLPMRAPSLPPNTGEPQKSSAISSSQRAVRSISAEQNQLNSHGMPALPSIDASVFSKRPLPSSPSASATASPSSTPLHTATRSKPSGLSSLLSKAPAQPRVKPDPPEIAKLTIEPPYKSVQTKHAGQQSLRVRSDGRLLVTAGWDSRVRIYSTKTLKEMAVLKWHKEGIYATDFGEILECIPSNDTPGQEPGVSGTSDILNSRNQEAAVSLKQSRLGGLKRVQQQREGQIQTKHWVVAGAKDGKVSLWEVF